jgi:putative transposase
MRWRQIKGYFSRHCRDEFKGIKQPHISIKAGRQAVWQGRYWEHQIRDNGDFISHVEYIHYNPVKHGLSKSPKLWPHSSFHRYVKQGLYHNDWGAGQEIAFAHHGGNE